MHEAFGVGQPYQGAPHRHLVLAPSAPHHHQINVIPGLLRTRFSHREASLLSEDGCVDVVNRLEDHLLEEALKHGHGQHSRLVAGQLSQVIYLYLVDGALHQVSEEQAQLLRQGHEEPHRLLHLRRDGKIDHVGDELALESGPDLFGDHYPRPVLGLLGGGAQVGGGHHFGMIYQGALRRRLLLEHVQARACCLAGIQGLEQGSLVDHAAPGHVEHPHPVLHLGELLLAQHVIGLRILGEMDGDEIGPLQEVAQLGHQLNARFLGSLLADIGVVGDDLHTEGLAAVGHQHADTAQAEDAHHLVIEFHPLELLPLPLPLAQGGDRLGQIAAHGTQESHGLLGRGDDIALGSVDYHDPPLGGGLDIYVVHAYPGPADHLEVLTFLDDIGIHLGAAANDKGIVIPDALQELLALHVGLIIHIELLFKELDTPLSDLLFYQDTGHLKLSSSHTRAPMLLFICSLI